MGGSLLNHLFKQKMHLFTVLINNQKEIALVREKKNTMDNKRIPG